jgi:hypothetical protein
MTLIRDIARGLRPEPLFVCWLILGGLAFVLLAVR